MKTQIISKLLLSLSLVFVLGSAITQVRGDTTAIEPRGPSVTIHCTDNVTRGKTGSFVLDMRQTTTSEKTYLAFHPYVNFSVSGTAIPGVDYVTLVSPAYIGPDGYGVILVKTLLDPRGSSYRQGYSVVVTLEPGLGYTLGPSVAAMSAKITIKP